MMANGMRDVNAAHGAAVVKAAKAVKQIALQTPKLAKSRILRHKAVYIRPLILRYMFLLVKMFLSASKAAVADLMRLPTSASEVRGLWMIKPRYLNSCVLANFTDKSPQRYFETLHPYYTGKKNAFVSSKKNGLVGSSAFVLAVFARCFFFFLYDMV